MAFLTENQLADTIDIPVSLATTDLRMGDWLAVATVKLVAPMRLTYRMAAITISAATVDTADIASSNLIYGNLGLAYLSVRKSYTGESPGGAGGLDALAAYGIGVYNRDVTRPLVILEPGVYTWVIANNMQPSTDATPSIPVDTSIDFRLSVVGNIRLELNNP